MGSGGGGSKGAGMWGQGGEGSKGAEMWGQGGADGARLFVRTEVSNVPIPGGTEA